MPDCQKNQTKAISIGVRKSHEVADVATRGDIADIKRDLEDVRKDISADIADVRKDMDAHFEKHKTQMQARFEKTNAQIADILKDMAARFEQIDKHLGFSEKRFDRLEIKFDRLQ